MAETARNTVALFTEDEHAIIAHWLGREPATTTPCPDPDAALKRLGFIRKPTNLYIALDAAVAHIVLEAVDNQLPNYGVIDLSGPLGDCVKISRRYRGPDDKPCRRVGIISRRLFAINWADTGPGLSWPVEYWTTWLPIYDRWVVTASADGDDAYGYPDFALGSFPHDTPIGEGAGEIIRCDWKEQLARFDQARWACLLGYDIIGEAAARRWADEVWRRFEGDFEDELN